MRLAGHMAHMGKKRNAYKILWRKPDEHRQVGTPGYKQENTIAMDRKDIDGGAWAGFI
jgi:hypothetical protein